MLYLLAGALEAMGGGKDSSGTSEVDDGVSDLGLQLRRGKRDEQLGFRLGYFWSHSALSFASNHYASPTRCPRRMQ